MIKASHEYLWKSEGFPEGTLEWVPGLTTEKNFRTITELRMEFRDKLRKSFPDKPYIVFPMIPRKQFLKVLRNKTLGGTQNGIHR